MRQVTRWLLTAVLLLGLGGVTTGCRTVPATGQRQFNVLSDEQEVRIGQEAAPQFTQEYGGPIPSEQVNQYISDLGHRLAAQSERSDLPWEFTALDSSVVNAFALPGGKVFITRGMLMRLDNEAQLAGILGHEIGHVTAMHIGQQMSQALILQGIGAALSIGADIRDNDALRVLGAGVGVGGTVYLLSFGRDQELQADRLGVRYMTALGYHPRGQLQVMEVLAALSEGSARQFEFLSTHPLPESRVRELERLIERQYPDADQPGRYVFNADEYRANVLEPLTNLPPARHGPQQP